MLLPRLQTNPADPPAALGNRSFKILCEIFPRRHELATAPKDGDDLLPVPQPMDPKTDFIVLRQRRGIENLVGMARRNTLERPARKSRPHAARRNEPAEQFPR